ncbi:hypothetical protein [Shinella sp. G-2]|uniref:hypothetical protein n=1 Tax=Shinella sp. G-2 TaxID=3133141 RepID=UPI003D03741A
MRRYVFVFASVCAVLTGCKPFGSQVLTACEDAIKQRLRSPTSYDRVSLRETEEQISRREDVVFKFRRQGYSAEETAVFMKEVDAAPEKVTLYAKTIEYDAKNAFGAPLRNRTTCEYFTIDGKEDAALASNVTLDGKSLAEWSASGG